jgi:hypothetical protein
MNRAVSRGPAKGILSPFSFKDVLWGLEVSKVAMGQLMSGWAKTMA